MQKAYVVYMVGNYDKTLPYLKIGEENIRLR